MFFYMLYLKLIILFSIYLIISLGQWAAIVRDGVRSNQQHVQTVTGNLTGNLTGDLTGDLTGNLTGDLTGD